MTPSRNRRRIIEETVARFPHLGTRTISHIILENHGDLFEQDYEAIRGRVRYVRGAQGEEKRKYARSTTPLHMPQTWRRPRTSYILTPGRWGVIADTHVPFHELKPIESAIAYLQKEKIDGLLLNGDIQDCASISFWMSGRKRDFDKELLVFLEFLDFLRYEFPDIPIVYKPGNHEYRLPRYYQTKAPDLIGVPLAVMEEALGLEARGIEYLDYNQLVMAGKLPILHGHEMRKMSTIVNPARGLFQRIKSWGMCSHFHRTSEHPERDIHGTLLTTWTTGCLCDLSPDYDPYSNGWNWGFATVEVDKNGDFTVDTRRILNSGKVV